ncbi:MAG: EpsG family protein, partial [Betaproteobacteria bacterium]|nr:EpsG family protein [Betaproteobacteria bacterium]
MTPYWILFIVAATGALTERARKPLTLNVNAKSASLKAKGLNTSWWLIAFGLTLFIGLRHEVGGDWFNYEANFQNLDFDALSVDSEPLGWLATREPIYRLFEWLSKELGGGIYLVNLLCAALFTYGLARFCRSLPRPWLALAAALPYLVIVVAMGYTRQGVAIGCAMAGLTALTQGLRVRYALWVLLAAGFHQTALLLLPLAVLVSSKRWFISLIAMGAMASVAAILALGDTLASYTHGYLEAAYQSEGAFIRLSMNLLPAMLFLALANRMAMADEERRLWRWLSVGAVLLMAFYVLSPSSTAVDRIGLYLIPLQLAVFAH